MAIARTAIIVSAGLTVPTFFPPPPLKSGPGPGGQQEYDVTILSQMARAGQEIYGVQCQNCHGEKALGSDRGPSLSHRAYADGRLSRQQFHRAVNNGVQANRWAFGDMPATRLSFNEIERVARYVREAGRQNASR